MTQLEKLFEIIHKNQYNSLDAFLIAIDAFVEQEKRKAFEAAREKIKHEETGQYIELHINYESYSPTPLPDKK